MRLPGGYGIHAGRILVTYGDAIKRHKYGLWVWGPGRYFEHWEVTMEYDPGRPRAALTDQPTEEEA